jgi:hypothetical protein
VEKINGKNREMVKKDGELPLKPAKLDLWSWHFMVSFWPCLFMAEMVIGGNTASRI